MIMYEPALEYFLETTTASLNERGFATDESEVYFCARLALLLFQNSSTPKTMLALQIYSDLAQKSQKYRKKLQLLLVANKQAFEHTALSKFAKEQIKKHLWELQQSKLESHHKELL